MQWFRKFYDPQETRNIEIPSSKAPPSRQEAHKTPQNSTQTQRFSSNIQHHESSSIPHSANINHIHARKDLDIDEDIYYSTTTKRSHGRAVHSPTPHQGESVIHADLASMCYDDDYFANYADPGNTTANPQGQAHGQDSSSEEDFDAVLIDVDDIEPLEDHSVTIPRPHADHRVHYAEPEHYYVPSLTSSTSSSFHHHASSVSSEFNTPTPSPRQSTLILGSDAQHDSASEDRHTLMPLRPHLTVDITEAHPPIDSYPQDAQLGGTSVHSNISPSKRHVVTSSTTSRSTGIMSEHVPPTLTQQSASELTVLSYATDIPSHSSFILLKSGLSEHERDAVLPNSNSNTSGHQPGLPNPLVSHSRKVCDALITLSFPSWLFSRDDALLLTQMVECLFRHHTAIQLRTKVTSTTPTVTESNIHNRLFDMIQIDVSFSLPHALFIHLPTIFFRDTDRTPESQQYRPSRQHLLKFTVLLYLYEYLVSETLPEFQGNPFLSLYTYHGFPYPSTQELIAHTLSQSTTQLAGLFPLLSPITFLSMETQLAMRDGRSMKPNSLLSGSNPGHSLLTLSHHNEWGTRPIEQFRSFRGAGPHVPLTALHHIGVEGVETASSSSSSVAASPPRLVKSSAASTSALSQTKSLGGHASLANERLLRLVSDAFSPTYNQQFHQQLLSPAYTQPLSQHQLEQFMATPESIHGHSGHLGGGQQQQQQHMEKHDSVPSRRGDSGDSGGIFQMDSNHIIYPHPSSLPRTPSIGRIQHPASDGSQPPPLSNIDSDPSHHPETALRSKLPPLPSPSSPSSPRAHSSHVTPGLPSHLPTQTLQQIGQPHLKMASSFHHTQPQEQSRVQLRPQTGERRLSNNHQELSCYDALPYTAQTLRPTHTQVLKYVEGNVDEDHHDDGHAGDDGEIPFLDHSRTTEQHPVPQTAVESTTPGDTTQLLQPSTETTPQSTPPKHIHKLLSQSGLLSPTPTTSTSLSDYERVSAAMAASYNPSHSTIAYSHRQTSNSNGPSDMSFFHVNEVVCNACGSSVGHNMTALLYPSRLMHSDAHQSVYCHKCSSTFTAFYLWDHLGQSSWLEALEQRIWSHFEDARPAHQTSFSDPMERSTSHADLFLSFVMHHNREIMLQHYRELITISRSLSPYLEAHRKLLQTLNRLECSPHPQGILSIDHDDVLSETTFYDAKEYLYSIHLHSRRLRAVVSAMSRQLEYKRKLFARRKELVELRRTSIERWKGLIVDRIRRSNTPVFHKNMIAYTTAFSYHRYPLASYAQSRFRELFEPTTMLFRSEVSDVLKAHVQLPSSPSTAPLPSPLASAHHLVQQDEDPYMLFLQQVQQNNKRYLDEYQYSASAVPYVAYVHRDQKNEKDPFLTSWSQSYARGESHSNWHSHAEYPDQQQYQYPSLWTSTHDQPSDGNDTNAWADEATGFFNNDPGDTALLFARKLASQAPPPPEAVRSATDTGDGRDTQRFILSIDVPHQQACVASYIHQRRAYYEGLQPITRNHNQSLVLSHPDSQIQTNILSDILNGEARILLDEDDIVQDSDIRSCWLSGIALQEYCVQPQIYYDTVYSRHIVAEDDIENAIILQARGLNRKSSDYLTHLHLQHSRPGLHPPRAFGFEDYCYGRLIPSLLQYIHILLNTPLRSSYFDLLRRATMAPRRMQYATINAIPLPSMSSNSQSYRFTALLLHPFTSPHTRRPPQQQYQAVVPTTHADTQPIGPTPPLTELCDYLKIRISSISHHKPSNHQQADEAYRGRVDVRDDDLSEPRTILSLLQNPCRTKSNGQPPPPTQQGSIESRQHVMIRKQHDSILSLFYINTSLFSALSDFIHRPNRCHAIPPSPCVSSILMEYSSNLRQPSSIQRKNHHRFVPSLSDQSLVYAYLRNASEHIALLASHTSQVIVFSKLLQFSLRRALYPGQRVDPSSKRSHIQTIMGISMSEAQIDSRPIFVLARYLVLLYLHIKNPFVSHFSQESHLQRSLPELLLSLRYQWLLIDQSGVDYFKTLQQTVPMLSRHQAHMSSLSTPMQPYTDGFLSEFEPYQLVHGLTRLLNSSPLDSQAENAVIYEELQIRKESQRAPPSNQFDTSPPSQPISPPPQPIGHKLTVLLQKLVHLNFDLSRYIATNTQSLISVYMDYTHRHEMISSSSVGFWSPQARTPSYEYPATHYTCLCETIKWYHCFFAITFEQKYASLSQLLVNPNPLYHTTPPPPISVLFCLCTSCQESTKVCLRCVLPTRLQLSKQLQTTEHSLMQDYQAAFQSTRGDSTRVESVTSAPPPHPQGDSYQFQSNHHHRPRYLTSQVTASETSGMQLPAPIPLPHEGPKLYATSPCFTSSSSPTPSAIAPDSTSYSPQQHHGRRSATPGTGHTPTVMPVEHSSIGIEPVPLSIPPNVTIASIPTSILPPTGSATLRPSIPAGMDQLPPNPPNRSSLNMLNFPDPPSSGQIVPQGEAKNAPVRSKKLPSSHVKPRSISLTFEEPPT